MGQKITMDMELRFIDNTSSGAKSASKAIDQIEKEAKEAGQELDNLAKKKAKPSVDSDTSKVDKKLSRIDATLKKLGFRKTKTTIDADDKATSKITNALNKLGRFAGRKFKAFLELKDSDALRSLNKMSDGLRNLTRKAWSIAIKVPSTVFSGLNTLKNSLFNIRNLIAGIASAWAAIKLIKEPIDVADAYSSAKISFSTLLGESQGQQMMDNLDQFAKATPFTTTSVIDNARKMLAMGWDAENIIEDMETIGNAAAATGKRETGLESIVRALSQIKTKGRLSTEELNQLAEAGIAAKAMLAEGLGYGTGDAGIAAMTEDLEEGLIASDVALEALLAGMQKYDGMMDSMANETVDGLISQLGDAFNINVVRRWGQGLQDGARRGLGTVLDLLDDAEGAMEKFGDTVYEAGAELSNWAADKLENAVQRISEITGSFEFQDASLGEKFKMLWKGLITDPLREWWEGGGRDKTVETAGEIGEWMGKTITSGLLAIFGVTDILDESNFPVDEEGNKIGMSVAQSFVDGFKANFDGSAITDAIVDAIGDVWGALPGWAKFLLGAYGVGKAAGGLANFAGGVASFAGGVKSIIGSSGTIGAGNTVVGASGLLGLVGKTGIYGVGGTGILGGLSKLGYGASAKTAALLGSTKGGAALLGVTGGTAALAGAGTLAAGASVIKGGYDLYKGYTTDDEIEAKASKASGWTTLGGVGAGAAIGSMILPGVGTLIGAGIGGIAGWLGGNAWADNIRASDDAINDVSAAVAELENEEEKLAAKNKLVWQNMQDHFGDIKLSMTEIKRLADQIVWGKDLESYEKFVSATKQAEASLQSLNSAGQQTDRWMWKAGLGVTFNDDEIESITASFDEYINSAKAYVENKHYEFSAAVSLLVDVESESGKSIMESGNAFYAKYKEDLDAAGQELGDLLTQSVADGFINAEEQAAITAAQQKMASITQKIADAETSAELQLIDLKFGDGKLDVDSFDNFMAQIQTTLDERMTANDEAFKVAVSALQLQLQEGAIDQTEYDKQLQALVDGYTAKVESVKADILDVELNIIGDAYEKELEKYGGDAATILRQGLEKSLAEGVDPINWTTEQARQFLGIDNLSESSAGAIAQMLGGVADQLQLVEVDGKLLVDMGIETEGVEPETVEEKFESKIPDALDEEITLNLTAFAQYGNNVEVLAEEFGIEDSYAAQILWRLSGAKGIENKLEILCTEFGIDLTRAETVLWTLSGEKQIPKPFSLTALDFGIQNTYRAYPTINVTPQIGTVSPIRLPTSTLYTQEFRGGIVGGSSSLEAFATGGIADGNDGGMVRGGAKLIQVAEEGSPEMIIPLSSQRRRRGLDLWEKAGQLMGVPGFARGGRTDGGADEGIRFLGAGSGSASGGQTVHVEVGGVKVELHVNADGSTNVVEAIKAQLGEITDAVVGAIADELGAMFENTPVRGGVA